MIKFILLTTQRSGSNLVGTCLNSHPDVVCLDELFMPRNRKTSTYWGYRTATPGRRMRHVFGRKGLIFEYLAEAEVPAAAFGFDLKYSQVRRYPDVVDWCRQNNVRVIHLVRRNTLKVLVSLVAASIRGVYLSSKPLQPVKVTLDAHRVVDKLDRMLAEVEANRRLFASHECLEVEYETFVANKLDEGNRLLRFLDVPEQPLTSPFVKHGSDSLRHTIENYDDVRKALEGTAYEQFLS